MTPTRLRECLDILGFNQSGLAEKLGCNSRTVRYWATGRNPVPDKIAEWLEACVEIKWSWERRIEYEVNAQFGGDATVSDIVALMMLLGWQPPPTLPMPDPPEDWWGSEPQTEQPEE